MSKWSTIESLPRAQTRITSRTPAATASSTMYWMVGRSTMGSSSLGTALVAGRKRVPRPAAGITALRMGFMSLAIYPPRARPGSTAPGADACRSIGGWYGAAVSLRAPALALLGFLLAGPAAAQESPLAPSPTEYAYARSI